MAKLIMLASVLAKLDTNTKAAFIGELTDLIRSKTGGLDFKISENDITKTVSDGDSDNQEEESEEAKQEKFAAACKNFADNRPGGTYGGINVQEM